MAKNKVGVHGTESERNTQGGSAVQKQDKGPKFPMTAEEFLAKASVLTIKIGEETKAAAPRQFSSGSVGYNLSDKVTIMIDGKPVKFQVGVNIIAIGSKPADAK
jgi:hypothetical protein